MKIERILHSMEGCCYCFCIDTDYKITNIQPGDLVDPRREPVYLCEFCYQTKAWKKKDTIGPIFDKIIAIVKLFRK